MQRQVNVRIRGKDRLTERRRMSGQDALWGWQSNRREEKWKVMCGDECNWGTGKGSEKVTGRQEEGTEWVTGEQRKGSVYVPNNGEKEGCWITGELSEIEMLQYKNKYLSIMLGSCQRSVPMYLLSNNFMSPARAGSQNNLKRVDRTKSLNLSRYDHPPSIFPSSSSFPLSYQDCFPLPRPLQA